MAENSLPPMVGDVQQQWGKKTVEDYREIVLKAIEKCREEGSKQMTKGIPNVLIYNEEIKSYEKVNLEDQRKVFEEAVNTLHDLLLYIFDDKIKERIKEIKKQKQGIFENLFQKYLLLEDTPKVKQQAIKLHSFVRTKIGKTFGDTIEQRYHELNRELFRELLLLFKRKNDLKSKTTISPFD